MRTALVLLFLLALASLPGALLPQWSLNSAKTAQYITDHPTIGPLLDRTGFFEVFGSPWYAAIYLLLFTSLIGCVLPRSWTFVEQIRAQPVVTPRNLSRLPHHAEHTVAAAPDAAADRIAAGLRGWRIARRPEIAADGTAGVTLSAEKGFLREVGNLVFHLSLVGLLIAVAVGKLVGYEGSVIVTGGDQFCSGSPASYDNFRPGLLVNGTDLSPFCVDVDSFSSSYNPQGQALDYSADVRYASGAALASGSPAADWPQATLRVNDPLRLDGERLYLLGHGFTPTFSVTFPDGQVRDYAEPFKPTPNDPNFTSEGAIKITDPPGVSGDDLLRNQLAIVGIFAPDALVHGGVMTSQFPAARNPGVAIDVYRGDLGLETGRSQSVFSIDTRQVDKGALVREARQNLTVGQSITLDDGTAITFTGYKEWVSLQTSYDPAQGWALVFSVTLLIGLMMSLVIKRRRVWFRLHPDGGANRTVVQVGGLARTDQAGYGEEFERLSELARSAGGATAAVGPRSSGDSRRESGG
ncbi:cytochrome c biogenesis protein ResB [Nakamurella flava]|uniref:Cytochrome c biogenesis protein ResB n=2 Tax=Nakamurella flava TaxID=2576308 RepID=A0A4U6QFF1_9ACTN|nr:cytochrome c biogenesis protein ResB [Nakamurella flava]